MLKLAALVSALLLVPAASALAKTKTVTVPGTLVFENGESPSQPGNCSAAIFAQWADDPGLKVLSARAIVFPPEGERSFAKEPPYDDTYDWVRVYQAPPGTHRILIGVSWGAGPVIPNDCADMTATHMGQWPNREARIELTVDDSAACAAAQKRAAEASKQLLKARTRLAQAPPPARRREGAKVAAAQAAKAKADKAVRAAC